MSSKEYKVLELPKKAHDMFAKARACCECKEMAIKLECAPRLAAKFGEKEIKFVQKAWNLVRDIYPEEFDIGVQYFYPGRELRYEPRNNTIHQPE